MSKPAKRPYLFRRGEVWWIRVAVPRALRHLYTSPHVEQSTGTKSVTEAEEMRGARVHLIKQDFKRKPRETGTGTSVNTRDAMQHLAGMRGAANDDEHELLSALATDHAERIEAKHGVEAAALFASQVFDPEVKTLRDAWDAWMLTCDFKAGTKVKYRRAFDEFMGFIGQADTLPAAITAPRVRDYVDWLNMKATRTGGRIFGPGDEAGTRHCTVGILDRIPGAARTREAW